MKKLATFSRKSDRVKFSPNDILKDLQDIYGTVHYRIAKISVKQYRQKQKRLKIRSAPKDLDGVLGLASFIRETEGLSPVSPSSSPCRAATHLKIAKFIYQDITAHS
ncbi:unnamed protein product [Blepharisma stoltei]|uniref:Uncharacterized protein n=1 Tax=Blepharisma stoltei TaxID=1481888 RepID=A0AAU9IET3_9CILI|nr:unnamed protein product [Blepharisma stoltei]